MNVLRMTNLNKIIFHIIDIKRNESYLTVRNILQGYFLFHLFYKMSDSHIVCVLVFVTVLGKLLSPGSITVLKRTVRLGGGMYRR